MKFGKYLESKQRPEWVKYYVNYKGLKDLIKQAQQESEKAGEASFSPRTTSLTVQRVSNKKDSASERFFKGLEEQVRSFVVLGSSQRKSHFNSNMSAMPDLREQWLAQAVAKAN
jgi:glycerophosphodiester phosphodiesterase